MTDRLSALSRRGFLLGSCATGGLVLAGCGEVRSPRNTITYRIPEVAILDTEDVLGEDFPYLAMIAYAASPNGGVDLSVNDFVRRRNVSGGVSEGDTFTVPRVMGEVTVRLPNLIGVAGVVIFALEWDRSSEGALRNLTSTMERQMRSLLTKRIVEARRPPGPIEAFLSVEGARIAEDMIELARDLVLDNALGLLADGTGDPDDVIGICVLGQSSAPSMPSDSKGALRDERFYAALRSAALVDRGDFEFGSVLGSGSILAEGFYTFTVEQTRR